ncbi:hypothetical protein DPMN_073035 [Dreissena polymorpha]|uniref:Uncharacterized protein n=1 Tax=Dreissena polymorpha TaxID=45954 RepID=A0A9D4HCM6_DREPO|nr:hypothetical protein DPMN_072993 [Dreissena polymorpha]KAH3713248.1 hypothetical protein DPMN_073035 [Dreissena polymorpha]
MAQVSLEQSTDRNQLRYNDLADIVDSIDTLQFLQGTDTQSEVQVFGSLKKAQSHITFFCKSNVG